MVRHATNTPSRRDFLKLAATAAAFGPYFVFPHRAFAAPRTLKIAKWSHFLPEFDVWFESMAKEWGQEHGMIVSVDEVPIENVYAQAKAEAKAGKGHDIFIFPWPPAEFQQFAIDHGPIYQIAAGGYGSVPQIAFKSTINFKTKKYFAFADSWIPAPLLYFQDCWQEASMPYGPLAYGSLRSGGKRVREKAGLPCGLAFTPTLEGNITCHTMLYAFGGTLMNAKGQVRIDARTMAALNFAKALYQDAGTPSQLGWDAGGNVQAMLARKISCTVNGISLLRQAEQQNLELAKQIHIQPPLLGSYGVTAFPHVTNCSVVWNFSKNQAVAMQFLADLINNSKTSYEKSLGCNFPAYQKALPDLLVRLEKDPHADPPGKYRELKDALHWTPNLGAPGLVTPAWMEAFNTFLVPRMFARVVKGEMNALDAARAAEAEMTLIAEKWKNV
jgi:multiple sugar transport system substrate-binding protein